VDVAGQCRLAASMGPRLVGRGKRVSHGEVCLIHNGLQWGRGLLAAERARWNAGPRDL